MNAPRVEAKEDHLLIRFEGLHAVGALRSSVVIPYSTIREASAERPSWPAFTTIRSLGFHVPGQMAVGTFRAPGGKRRFVDLEKGAQKALKLELSGHPEFDEVEIEAEMPEQVVTEIAKHRPIEVKRPPVYE